jgi:hypothetical protein
MIAAALTAEFGVLASDSAHTVETGFSFEVSKLAKVGNYLLSFSGTQLYLSNMNRAKFNGKMDQLSLYVQGFLKEARPNIEELIKEKMSEGITSGFSLYVMGVHAKRPTLASFRSTSDFKPKYFWAEKEIKMAPVLSADDDIEGSSLASSVVMDQTLKSWTEAKVKLDPGIVGEVLIRGIQKKSDFVFEATKKKSSGGVTSAAVLKADGAIYSLSGMEVINGGI